jgi:transposase
MSDNSTPDSHHEPTAQKSRAAQIPIETRDEMVALHNMGYGTRRIARRVGWSRKIVRRILLDQGCLEPKAQQTSSKLDPFRQTIEDKVRKGLTITRIRREIKQLGYQGGRTILADYVRQLRTRIAPQTAKRVKRRFETRPGLEMQIDWSPYRLRIGGAVVLAHALGCLLCASRKLFLHFFRDERQSSLLEGLAMAFEYFGGCTLRLVLDNMATAVLGRYAANGKPVWHPRFLDFVRHYGFEPFACAVRDADRKGKKEKSFRLVWDDFLNGSEFESWQDLNRRARIWLDHTPEAANLRVHATTRRVPNEAWLSEQDFLIRLPEKRFPVYEDTIRLVDDDSTIWVHGTCYTVPSSLGKGPVPVHLFAEHFEVFDRHGRLAFSRRYVPDADKGKLVIDKTHYATGPRRPRGSDERLDQAFLKRYPSLAQLVSGLQLKMKSLAPVHIRALLRLADLYGEQAFIAAANRAQHYRRFDARAVERILERDHGPVDDAPLTPLGGFGPALVGDVDQGSLDDYGHLDAQATEHQPDNPDQQPDRSQQGV